MFNRLPGAMLISGHFCTNEARALAAVMFAVAYPRCRRIVTGYSIRPQLVAVLIRDCLGVSAPVPPAIWPVTPRPRRLNVCGNQPITHSLGFRRHVFEGLLFVPFLVR